MKTNYNNLTKFNNDFDAIRQGEAQSDPNIAKALESCVSILEESAPNEVVRFLNNVTTIHPSSEEESAILKSIKKIAALDLCRFSKEDIPGSLSEINKINDPELKKRALGSWISENKISIKKLNLSEEEMVALGPYLTYLNLEDGVYNDNTGSIDNASFSEEFIKRLLENSPKLSGLNIMDSKIEGSCLQSLSNNSRLVYVGLGSCPNLTSFPGRLPECKWFACCGCDALTTLPELPKCQSLQSLKCPIITLPELPWNVRIISDFNSTQSTILEVDIDEISSNPKKYLDKLGNYLQYKSSFPEVSYFKGKEPLEGVDEGGLRRDFVTRLVKNIYSVSEENFLKYKEGPNQGVLPLKDDRKCLRTLGRLFALCAQEGSSFKIGPVFDSLLFEGIKAEDRTKIFAKINAIPERVVELAESADGKGFEDSILVNAGFILDIEEGKPEGYFDSAKHREELKEELQKQMKEDEALFVMNLIAEEMKAVLGGQAWDRLKDVDLQSRIQGELTKDLLKEKLDWSQQHEGITAEEVSKIKGFTEDWIGRASKETLERFVWAVSSNRTLGPQNLKVKLFHRGPDYLPVAHTCFFSIEFSTAYPDQETFDNKLNLLLTEGLESGFTIA